MDEAFLLLGGMPLSAIKQKKLTYRGFYDAKQRTVVAK